MNFIAQSTDTQTPGSAAKTITLTMKPSRGFDGTFSYNTDSYSLLKMLRQETELRITDLDRFRDELRFSKNARLFSVEMSVKALTEIGYFVD